MAATLKDVKAAAKDVNNFLDDEDVIATTGKGITTKGLIKEIKEAYEVLDEDDLEELDDSTIKVFDSLGLGADLAADLKEVEEEMTEDIEEVVVEDTEDEDEESNEEEDEDVEVVVPVKKEKVTKPKAKPKPKEKVVPVKKEKKAKVAPKPASVKKDKKELSRYGHQLGSQRALIDDMLHKGATGFKIVEAVMEAFPDDTIKETKLAFKATDQLRATIRQIKLRGVDVEITRTKDGNKKYKATKEFM